MATAAIKHAAHKLSRDKPPSSDPPQIDHEKCQREKQSIAEYYDNARPLPPDQIAESPRNKELATSSRNLRIQDFELIKTLGTGTLTADCSGSRGGRETEHIQEHSQEYGSLA